MLSTFGGPAVTVSVADALVIEPTESVTATVY
jgi:glycine cleavage system protein P-like pyridoxal-binding family